MDPYRHPVEDSVAGPVALTRPALSNKPSLGISKISKPGQSRDSYRATT